LWTGVRGRAGTRARVADDDGEVHSRLFAGLRGGDRGEVVAAGGYALHVEQEASAIFELLARKASRPERATYSIETASVFGVSLTHWPVGRTSAGMVRDGGSAIAARGRTSAKSVARIA
jgi:hypothetical protein